MIRTLQFKLGLHLRKKLDLASKTGNTAGTSKKDLAEKIGISPPKLRDILEDRWEYVTRDSIERVADYLELDASSVLEFEHCAFWDSIDGSKNCTFLRGSRTPPAQNPDDHLIPPYDHQATAVVRDYLFESFGIGEPPVADRLQEEDEIIRRAQNENCIVIGAPKSNYSTEIVLSRYFKARPFTGDEKSRKKIPFGFCWQDGSKATKTSNLTCSSRARTQSGGTPGIAFKDGHVPADFRDPEEFRRWHTEKGFDCGVVFVANRPFQTRKPTKLIVLAGYSGIGTVAAAHALVRDCRDLEPLPGEDYVYGIVQATYSKEANNPDGRRFKSFRWAYRKGGRRPKTVLRNNQALD